jgi:hypothetical protein
MLTNRHMSLYDYADKIEKATLSVSHLIGISTAQEANIRPSPRASTSPVILEEKPVLKSTLMLS